jgi:RimJ/RimL family protein N-acetyltransferase
VGDFNRRARRCYERMGFVAYGLERRALKLPDRYVDEVLMTLWL